MYRTLFFFIVFFAVSVCAQVEFPMASKIINVTKDPYYAKGDGKTDDTEAIQKALNDHPDGDYIIYLPHGIYKITDGLTWPVTKKQESSSRRTILQGQNHMCCRRAVEWCRQCFDLAKLYDGSKIPVFW